MINRFVAFINFTEYIQKEESPIEKQKPILARTFYWG